jgi:putative ABC transport system ATP-binding protein
MELIGVGGQRARARAGELLEYLGVADRADQLPEQLSGGEKQRVAIARALANEPKIILADEPTAALDTERGLSVMRLLRQITNEHGTATLVVTHDTRMIGEVDRVIRLQDGQVVDRPEEALVRQTHSARRLLRRLASAIPRLLITPHQPCRPFSGR